MTTEATAIRVIADASQGRTKIALVMLDRDDRTIGRASLNVVTIARLERAIREAWPQPGLGPTVATFELSEADQLEVAE